MTDSLSTAVNRVLLPGFSGTEAPRWLLGAVEDGLAGVLYFAHNTPDLATTARLSQQLHEARADLLVAIDEEGGDVSRLQAADGSGLPGAGALGAVDDAGLTHEAGRALGDLLAAVGVDLDLAPVLDVNSAADNPVIGVRAFGSTPDVVARHGTAFLAGLREAGVATCGKHFPGHGATIVDSHLALPVVPDDLATVESRDLPPFAAAVEAGIDALMTAHVVVPALGAGPATLDAAVVGRARALGLAGPVITDALDMGAVVRDPGFGEACVRALLAGADLLCLGTTRDRDDEALYRQAHAAVSAAVGSGRLSRARLDEAASRTARLARRPRPAPRPWQEAVERLDEVGARAARRAVRWAGEPQTIGAGAPTVLDLRTRLDHAAGRLARHLQTAVAQAWPGAVVADTTTGATPQSSGAAGERVPGTTQPVVLTVPDVPRTGPVLLVTRNPAGDPAEHALLTAVLAARHDAIVLHTGPDTSAPRLRHVLLTWGVGRANARAAVEVLRG